jgi:hypothetical protein
MSKVVFDVSSPSMRSLEDPAPIPPGSGVLLFDHALDARLRVERIRVIDSPAAAQPRYRVRAS